MILYSKSKKIQKNRRNQGLALMSILIILSVFVFVFVYLIQVNDIVGISFKIRRQEEHLKELRNNNQELETQIARLQSLTNLEERVKGLDMTEVGLIKYLKIDKAVVVQK